MKKPILPKIGKKKGREEAPAVDTTEAAVNFAAAEFSSAPDYPSSAFAAPSASFDDSSDGFDVNVRNAESGIRLLDQKKENPWLLRELPHEIATVLSLMSVFALLLAAGGFGTTVPFLLAGVIVYMALTVLEEKMESRIKLFAAAGAFAVLVVLAIVMRKYLWGGIGTIMNAVYDASEATQAYIYDRIDIGSTADEQPGMCLRTAAVWLSSLLGLLAALPPAAVRRAIGLGAAIIAMIMFAYYGIIPAAVVILLMIIALVFVLARGGLLSALPVLLVSLMLFGIIMLIAPGESIGISRADENFRDRFALKSAYLENNVDPGYQDDMNDPYNEDQDVNDDENGFVSEHRWLLPLIIGLLVLAGIGAAGFFLFRRYKMRRDANREGIDSDDPRTAIVAMFPYAVKWLGAGDVEVSGKNFASLANPLRHLVSEQYSKYFSSMYVLWREAAYSDHEMREDQRAAMHEFMEETSNMVKRDLDFRGKIRTALKYAL